MDYLVLAETDFFGLINGAGNCKGLGTAYDSFVKAVISLCYECTDRRSIAVALAYAENELQHHHTQYMATEKAIQTCTCAKHSRLSEKCRNILLPTISKCHHYPNHPTQRKKQ